MEVIQYISPALITLLGNFLFYKYFQRRYEKSLEEFKISYTGIHKERIQIYRDLLKLLLEVKYKVSRFNYGLGDSQEIMLEINSLLSFLRYNRPFMSPKVKQSSEKFVLNLQEVFDAFFLFERKINSGGKIDEEVNKNYVSALNKIRSNQDFSKLEDYISDEIRSSLGLDKF
jgi:hypothetical protein